MKLGNKIRSEKNKLQKHTEYGSTYMNLHNEIKYCLFKNRFMKESKTMIKHSGPWFALGQRGQKGLKRTGMWEPTGHLTFFFMSNTCLL